MFHRHYTRKFINYLGIDWTYRGNMIHLCIFLLITKRGKENLPSNHYYLLKKKINMQENNIKKIVMTNKYRRSRYILDTYYHTVFK